MIDPSNGPLIWTVGQAPRRRHSAPTLLTVSPTGGPAARPTVHVSGGAGGYAAAVETLEAAAAALRAHARLLEDLPHRFDLHRSVVTGVAAAALAPVQAVRLEMAHTAAFGGAAGGLLSCVENLRTLAASVSVTAAAYRAAEAAADLSWSQLVHAEIFSLQLNPLTLPFMMLAKDGLGTQIDDLLPSLSWRRHVQDPPDAPSDGPDDLPWYTHVGADPTQATLAAVAALSVIGGVSPQELTRNVLDRMRKQGVTGGTATRVQPAELSGVEVLPTKAPRDAAALLRSSALTGSDPIGGVEKTPTLASARILLQKVQDAQGRVIGAIVTIPGTQAWSSGGPNPADVQSDIELTAGERSAAQDAVEEVLTAAGVSASTPLMLVGHSQGGLVASALAADPAFRQRFNPTAVLTAGSPVGDVPAAPTVNQLHLEHSDDLVTGLDGRDNPDRPRETTVVEKTPDGFAPHDLEGYALEAEDAHRQGSVSVRDWEASAAPFLDAPGVTVSSSLWDATRTELSPR